MTENALSILIVIFPYNSNKLRPQTESCVFSSLALRGAVGSFKKRTHPTLKEYITSTRTTQCPTVQAHTPHCMQEDQAYSKQVV